MNSLLLVKSCRNRLTLLRSCIETLDNVTSKRNFKIRTLSTLLVSANLDQRLGNQNWNASHQTHGRLTLLTSTPDSQYIPHRNAGHSKWANIKHQKSVADQQKAIEIEKYIRAIRTAAKENNSPDPKVNKKLADVIDRAKAAKVPSSSIQKALDFLARGFSKAGDFKQLTMIMKGPGGAVLIASMETDHVSKLRMDLTPILRKHGFVAGADSLLHMFDKKGIVLCTGLNEKPLKEEHLEQCVDHAIEAEAEEVNWVESPTYGPVMEFSCEPQDFYKLCKNLESMNYEIVYSEIDFLPKSLVELDSAHLDVVGKFHEKLLAHADVTKIYDNIA